MSAEVVPIDPVAGTAVAYAQAGFLVFPLRWPTKEPLGGTQGFKDASSDPEVVESWFRERRNLGLATGPQPNGMNLLAVDVDTDKGGKVSFLDLVDRHDGRDLLRAAPQHLTPRGGWHLFFDAPSEYRNTRESMGKGIDTRGAGGYVVLPPSRWANEDGELKPYVAKPGLGLLERPPLALPGWMMEALSRPEIAPLPPERRSPGLYGVGMSEGTSPYDFARETLSWPEILLRHGWMPLRRQPGGDQLWRRPGKTDRGHSAVLHTSGAFVVFTTDIPPQLERLGTPTRDGTGTTISIGDFVCAYEHGGDRSSFAKAMRGMMPSTPERSSVGTQLSPAAGPAAEEAPSDFLPDSFWEARPVFGAIREMARARMVGPDALMVNMLVRWATLIPPQYKLPAIVGTVGTFDLLACVVAETGVGKTAAWGASTDLVTTRVTDGSISFDIPLGSGEGVPQWFMVDEIGEDGKRTGKQVVGKQACHFVVDEATAFVAQGQRQGNTTAPTLTSAWSGSTLGQANAKLENRRIIPGGMVRVTASLGMQASNAHMLFTPELTTLGFAGRLLFARAEDPGAPDVTPDEPEMPHFPNLALFGPEHTVVQYDPAIVNEIRTQRRQVLRQELEVDKTQSQHLLLRCKVAGILALQDGRRIISLDDWSLAATILQTSSGCQRRLAQVHASEMASQRETAARSRGEAESIVEDVKERKAISRLGDSIVAKVLTNTGDPLTLRQLARAVTSSATRHRFEPALEWAVKAGRITTVGEHVYPGCGGEAGKLPRPPRGARSDPFLKVQLD